jgi:hypothetical protein
VLDFHYRLVHNAVIAAGDRRRVVPVEVILHVRLERCPGPLALGDLVYSTTLLPGEKVRLFSTDRRTRYSFDSATSLSYRSEQTSEERYYMSSMSESMSDLQTRDRGSASSSSTRSYQDRVSASGALESFFAGPSVSMSGTHTAQSTSDFMRELSQHAEASHHRTETATRALNSVSIGEVQSRSHAEGESEDHFESTSRVFENPNRCRAISFYFYQINKTQTVRLTIVSITRRVIDDAADTRVTNNPPRSNGDVTVIPEAVRSVAKDRLEIESIGLASASRLQRAEGNVAFAATSLAAVRAAVAVEPIDEKTRRAALSQVEAQLVATGLIDEKGAVGELARRSFEFERRSSLPTGGMLVRGCLDECNICEPELHEAITIELERKRLENELLKRQIELLDKSQEYRCCPGGEEPVA